MQTKNCNAAQQSWSLEEQRILGFTVLRYFWPFQKSTFVWKILISFLYFWKPRSQIGMYFGRIQNPGEMEQWKKFTWHSSLEVKEDMAFSIYWEYDPILTNTRYANINSQMQIGLDEHMILPEIWQYKHTCIFKYKMLEDIYWDNGEGKRKISEHKHS